MLIETTRIRHATMSLVTISHASSQLVTSRNSPVLYASLIAWMSPAINRILTREVKNRLARQRESVPRNRLWVRL